MKKEIFLLKTAFSHTLCTWGLIQSSLNSIEEFILYAWSSDSASFTSCPPQTKALFREQFSSLQKHLEMMEAHISILSMTAGEVQFHSTQVNSHGMDNSLSDNTPYSLNEGYFASSWSFKPSFENSWSKRPKEQRERGRVNIYCHISFPFQFLPVIPLYFFQLR